MTPLDWVLPEWLGQAPALGALALTLWYLAGERASRKDERLAFASALTDQRHAFAVALREQRDHHAEETAAFVAAIDGLRDAIVQQTIVIQTADRGIRQTLADDGSY